MPAQPRMDLGTAAGLRYWSIGTILGLLWTAAVLIGWRRMAEAIDVPLQPAVLLGVGVVVAAAAAAVRLVRRYLPTEAESSQPDWLPPLLATLAVLALGVGLSLRGTDSRGLLAFWAVLLAEETWAWRPVMWRSRPRHRRPRTMSPRKGSNTAERRGVRRTTAAVADGVPADGVPADDVLQQLTRSHAADGSEQLSGWLRAPFVAGQRTAVVHLAFCPQFANAPELAVEQLDGPELQRVNQAVFSFGARVDLKLVAAAEEPLDVLLRFSARSAPPTPPPATRPNTP